MLYDKALTYEFRIRSICHVSSNDINLRNTRISKFQNTVINGIVD